MIYEKITLNNTSTYWLCWLLTSRISQATLAIDCKMTSAWMTLLQEVIYTGWRKSSRMSMVYEGLKKIIHYQNGLWRIKITYVPKMVKNISPISAVIFKRYIEILIEAKLLRLCYNITCNALPQYLWQGQTECYKRFSSNVLLEFLL